MILTTPSSKDLAQRVAKNLGRKICCVETIYYTKNEVFMNAAPSGQTVIAFFPNTNDANLNLIEFLFLIKNFKNIIAVIPYIPYSRQDRNDNFRTVLNVLKSSNVKTIITLDIHSLNSINTAEIQVVNIYPHEIFSNLYKKTDDILFVAPDNGAKKRSQLFADHLELDIIFIDKNLKTTTNTKKIKGKKCVIIDDIIDSGRTLEITTSILKQNDAKTIEAFITHHLNTPYTPEIDKIYTTESLPLKSTSINTEVILIDKILSKTILNYL